jgi:hypothetical protein
MPPLTKVTPICRLFKATKKQYFLRKLLSSRGDKSENIGARVKNHVTQYVVVDKTHIIEVDTLRNENVIMKNILLHQNFNPTSGRRCRLASNKTTARRLALCCVVTSNKTKRR